MAKAKCHQSSIKIQGKESKGCMVARLLWCGVAMVQLYRMCGTGVVRAGLFFNVLNLLGLFIDLSGFYIRGMVFAIPLDQTLAGCLTLDFSQQLQTSQKHNTTFAAVEIHGPGGLWSPTRP